MLLFQRAGSSDRQEQGQRMPQAWMDEEQARGRGRRGSADDHSLSILLCTLDLFCNHINKVNVDNVINGPI